MNILIVNYSAETVDSAIRFLDVRDLVLDDVLAAFLLYTERTGVKIDPIGHVAAKRWLNFDMVSSLGSIIEIMVSQRGEHRMKLDLTRIDGFAPAVRQAVLSDWAREIDSKKLWHNWVNDSDRARVKNEAILSLVR